MIILQNELYIFFEHLRHTSWWENENVFFIILIVEKLPSFKLGNIAIVLGWKAITSHLIWQSLHIKFFSKFQKPLKFCDYVKKIKSKIWNKLG